MNFYRVRGIYHPNTTHNPHTWKKHFDLGVLASDAAVAAHVVHAQHEGSEVRTVIFHGKLDIAGY